MINPIFVYMLGVCLFVCPPLYSLTCCLVVRALSRRLFFEGHFKKDSKKEWSGIDFEKPKFQIFDKIHQSKYWWM
jgi:hypothetical protein